MAPLMAFIAMIELWHAIAVLAFVLVVAIVGFLTDQATPTAVRVGDAFFYLLGMPIMLFAIGSVFFAVLNRHYNASEIFPSVFVGISAFLAVALIGTVRKDPGFGAKIGILMGVVVSLLMSGLLVAVHFLFMKIGL